MLITISGLSGSGKSTTARALGRRLGIPTIDVGGLFRAQAERHGMDLIQFERHVQTNPELDRRLDASMMREARRRKNLILQGRLAGCMTKRRRVAAYRVWLAAKTATRAARTAEREGTSPEDARRGIVRRDRRNRLRYLKTYGLDLNDLSVYDIVVQTDNLSVDQIVEILAKNISRLWPKKHKTPLRRQRRPPTK